MITVGGLAIDTRSHEVTVDGRPVDLARKEFELLLALARRAGEVVTKRDLLAEVWQLAWGGSDRTVDVHLSWLRRKLGETAAEPRYLHSVRGVGVKLAAPERGLTRAPAHPAARRRHDDAGGPRVRDPAGVAHPLDRRATQPSDQTQSQARYVRWRFAPRPPRTIKKYVTKLSDSTGRPTSVQIGDTSTLIGSTPADSTERPTPFRRQRRTARRIGPSNPDRVPGRAAAGPAAGG